MTIPGAASMGAAGVARWQRYLLAEVDGASLALFRVAFGGIMLWEVVRYFVLDRVHRYYIEPKLFFSYLPFVTPWSGSGMVWHFLLLGALSILIAAGLFYRLAAPLFCAAFSYVFLLDEAQYLNHLYLVCLVSLLLVFVPANRVGSLDRRRSSAPPPETVPRWCLLILRAQIALVYFYGGIAKLNADWLQGEPLGMWLAERADRPLVGPLLALPVTALVLSYGALLIDLSLGFLLFFRRTFPIGAAIAVLFNVLNAFLFEIGIFPLFMIATLVLFPDPGWPRRAWQRIREDVLGRDPPGSPDTGGATGPSSGALAEPPTNAEPSTAAAPASGRRGAVAGLVLLHGYLLVQLLVPLRHWLYPGDVSWNEAGHRFSWRMKLRDKDVGELGVYALDPATGARERVDLEAWLTDRQIDAMGSRPDMILAFARFVAEQRLAETGAAPVVTAEVSVSLNGGPYRYLLDPAADLAAGSGSSWIHRGARSRVTEAPRAAPRLPPPRRQARPKQKLTGQPAEP